MTTDRITTAEELNALPVGSVVVDRDNDVWARDDRTRWVGAEVSCCVTSRLLRYGPFYVLHRPDCPSDLAADVERLRAQNARLLVARNAARSDLAALRERIEVLMRDAQPHTPFGAVWKSALRDAMNCTSRINRTIEGV